MRHQVKPCYQNIRITTHFPRDFHALSPNPTSPPLPPHTPVHHCESRDGPGLPARPAAPGGKALHRVLGHDPARVAVDDPVVGRVVRAEVIEGGLASMADGLVKPEGRRGEGDRGFGRIMAVWRAWLTAWSNLRGGGERGVVALVVSWRFGERG